MERAFCLSAITGLLFLCTSLQGIAHAEKGDDPVRPAVPTGLIPCPPDDPVAVFENRAAPSIGGQFLSCFRSERRTEVQSATGPVQVPFEYAFAIRINGDGYAPADLDKLLSTVSGQWKNFQPLNKEFRENYIARLNELIKGVGATAGTISSVKPVLVSIGRLDAKSYSVVSIRSYTFDMSGKKVAQTKVNADAVVLQGGSLVRLTMQRVLVDVSDVAQLQAEISQWARAFEDKDARTGSGP